MTTYGNTISSGLPVVHKQPDREVLEITLDLVGWGLEQL